MWMKVYFSVIFFYGDNKTWINMMRTTVMMTSKKRSKTEIEKINNKIVLLELELKALKTKRSIAQKSYNNENSNTEACDAVDGPEVYGLKAKILEWETINKSLGLLDQQFASMLYCIRFTQMTYEYITKVVEKSEDVMKVTGIDYLVSKNALKVGKQFKLYICIIA
ncbi:hypothetical protein BDF14DRAFT_334268 [Spinellus fusiger]|nr:hypothetical protein BDF14DRAFT_334268 [Spinellus fusiger]